MSSTCGSALEITVKDIYRHVDVHNREFEWPTVCESRLWFELVSCVLGSQVSYENSFAAACYLRSAGLLDVNLLLWDGSSYEDNIQKALQLPIYPSRTRTSGAKYRFPNHRACSIRKTVDAIYLTGHTIKEILLSSFDERDARKSIISFAVGVGPKQASLFLRNIGFASNLAVLDTHVLRYMAIIGLLTDELRTVGSLRRYEQIEQVLASYAKRLNANLKHLDTAIWIVMRAFRQIGLE